MSYSPDCRVNSFSGFSQDTTLVVGVWNWAYTSQPSNGCVNSSPETQDYKATVEFTEDGEYKATNSLYGDDTGTYHFEGLLPARRLLVIKSRSGNPFYVNEGTLIIDDRATDGPLLVYSRAK